MKEVKRRLLNFLIAFDQLLWSIVTLGHAAPDETISAGAYRMEQQGKWQGKYSRLVIDWLFTYLQTNHCYVSYKAEIEGKQRRII
jgi:hypothetical protein